MGGHYFFWRGGRGHRADRHANEMAKVKPYETGYLQSAVRQRAILAHPARRRQGGKPANDDLPRPKPWPPSKASKPWQLEDANGMLHFFTPIKVHEA